ncbi:MULTISPECIES: hypothetical protein [Mucilaginibacter]|jgi:hypothetical protein|uniref:hypothetical protein n=1 Tax=Mucilaginibacter TaxID=423349 RepID=UPI00159DDE6C|nr:MULTISPECIES: hypothetical protein [Mucilaginibacter]NVM62900.1 hypothetical protein [Mucilaginibacter sp. SG538B]
MKTLNLHIISGTFFNSINSGSDNNMGVACGPGFTLQVLAFLARNPTLAAGFTLQSLTRLTHYP